MIITMETTEPLNSSQADCLAARLNATSAYANMEIVLHSEQVLMLSGTDVVGQHAASLDDTGQAPVSAQLAVARSQDFYSAATGVSLSSTPLSSRLRTVHFETSDEHIVLVDSPEFIDLSEHRDDSE